MSQEKVNPGLSLTDSTSSVDEGLRVLARMIARRLKAKKADVGEQHPRPVLPPGGVDQKTDLQSPGTADGKQAVPPSDCKKMDTGCPDKSRGANG